MAVLRHILLLQRDVAKAAAFYHQGLGLAVKTATERWAELQSGGTTIALKAVDGCVACGRPRRASSSACVAAPACIVHGR